MRYLRITFVVLFTFILPDYAYAISIRSAMIDQGKVIVIGRDAERDAEILWDGNANYSSSDWEIYNAVNGNFLAYATEYGFNGASNIWTNVNGGAAVSGISTNANWIYTANNFEFADEYAWIRTSITVVPEPSIIALFGLGLLGLGFARRKKA